MRGGESKKLVFNLLATFVVMVLLLFAVALLGGVGTVELALWAALLVISLAVVAKRSGQGSSG
jgi:hypothetical protein